VKDYTIIVDIFSFRDKDNVLKAWHEGK